MLLKNNMLTIDKAKSILCKRLGFNGFSIICDNKEFLKKFKNYYKAATKKQNTNNEYSKKMIFEYLYFKTLFDVYSIITPC